MICGKVDEAINLIYAFAANRQKTNTLKAKAFMITNIREFRGFGVFSRKFKFSY